MRKPFESSGNTVPLKVNDKDSFFEYVEDLDYELKCETDLCKEFAPRILCEGYRGYV